MSNKISTNLFILFIALFGFTSCANLGSAQAKDPANETPAIQDSLILEGWNALRNLKNPIPMGDGEALSGEKLAQFLLEQQIPVVWGSDTICSGSSCSQLYCSSDGRCSYEDGNPGIDPIYLNPAIQTQTSGQKSRLARDLAHEIYHRTRPFGNGMTSHIEEFWAFYLEAKLTKSSWPKFDGIDPQDPQQLEQWFKDHGLQGYLQRDSGTGPLSVRSTSPGIKNSPGIQ